MSLRVTASAQRTRRSCRDRPVGRARDEMTRSFSRVRISVATPESIDVEIIRPLMRVSDRTPTYAPPVVRAVRPDRPDTGRQGLLQELVLSQVPVHMEAVPDEAAPAGAVEGHSEWEDAFEAIPGDGPDGVRCDAGRDRGHDEHRPFEY